MPLSPASGVMDASRRYHRRERRVRQTLEWIEFFGRIQINFALTRASRIRPEPGAGARFFLHGSPGVQDALELIGRGADEILKRDELEARLALRRPLRIKPGFDPTAPDLHLAHTVPLTKLRQ